MTQFVSQQQIHPPTNHLPEEINVPHLILWPAPPHRPFYPWKQTPKHNIYSLRSSFVHISGCSSLSCFNVAFCPFLWSRQFVRSTTKYPHLRAYVLFAYVHVYSPCPPPHLPLSCSQNISFSRAMVEHGKRRLIMSTVH